MLHTHKTNAVARYLIDKGRVPGLEGARVIGQEIPIGHSRFDLLVEDQGKHILIGSQILHPGGESVGHVSRCRDRKG